MIFIFTTLALLTSFIMSMLGGYAVYRHLIPAAGIIFGVGTLIVFTLGRLNGMREMIDELQKQGQNGTSRT